MIELTPEERSTLTAQAKRQIRSRMRALRKALPASSVSERSARIRARLAELEAYRSARKIALFWPMRDKNEVDLALLDETARASGKAIFYPFMDPSADGYKTGFRLTQAQSELRERGRGFAEPDPSAPEAKPGELDLVVVPALAACGEGYRVGYGIGFYDVTLPDQCPPAVAAVVVFDFQLLAEAPHADGDFRCSLVVTDERVIEAARCAGAG